MTRNSKCVMCGREAGGGWVYEWNGKVGSMHQDPCGRDFHAIGYYLLNKAQETLEKQGISVIDTKEKFGGMRLASMAKTEKQRDIVKKLKKEYDKRYSEFSWYFL